MLNVARNGAVSGRRWKSVSEIDFRPSESHVLAVDDSIIDRKVIERLLRTTSCKVTMVDSGMRALEFLGLDEQNQRSSVVDGLKIDLIITDYCMPGMTGYELLKRIKESSTFKETPVVVMSSENVVTRIDRCLEEGAEEFILKPVKLSDVKRLRDYISREDRSKGLESAINNKRKQMEGPDLSSQSPPSSRSSSPSDSFIPSPDSNSVSLSSSSPSSPFQQSDSPMDPSSPSGPSDSSVPSSPLIDSSTSRLKMTDPDEIEPTF